MQRFTDAVRKSIHDENWFSGLFLALCLPDICGALETPEARVGERYKRWFDAHLAKKYAPMFSADDCYAFRCSCLHQGLDRNAKLTYERIHFITPPGNNIAHLNEINTILQLQIDIFCKDIADAVDAWYEAVAKKDPIIQSRVDDLIKIYGGDSLKPYISFGD